MNKSRQGPLLVFIGVFGGGIFWLVACYRRFNELLEGFWHGYTFSGESIWALDPVFTILAALPGLVLFLVGFMIAISPIIGKQSEDASSKASVLDTGKRIRLNLFYIGEVFLLATAIAGAIAFLGASQSTITIILVPTVIFAIIIATCTLNLLSLLYYVWMGNYGSTKITSIARNTILFLTIELVVLTIAVLMFQLYIWSFIRSTSIFLLLSGCFSIFLLFPSANIRKNEDGAEGEI